MAWNPTQSSKEIAFCDSRGYLGLLENVTGGGGQPAAVATEQSSSTMLDDDEVEFSISQIKKATGFVEEDGHDVFAGTRSSFMGKLFSLIASINHVKLNFLF